MGGNGLGFIGNVILGMVGGVVGNILLNLLGISFVGDLWIIGSIIAGALGGVIIIFLARTVLGNRSFGL
ncbi:MAG: GlsB/YeaQ/YmgE family stress response membrane protein [Armatimonadetes bacterium]|nr:GlsB/YeaQ/YmgE family stress response membrane protein [Anaerolineae bacterium]